MKDAAVVLISDKVSAITIFILVASAKCYCLGRLYSIMSTTECAMVNTTIASQKKCNQSSSIYSHAVSMSADIVYSHSY